MKMNGQFYIPVALPPGNEPQYPCWESKDSSVVQAVAQSLY